MLPTPNVKNWQIPFLILVIMARIMKLRYPVIVPVAEIKAIIDGFGLPDVKVNVTPDQN